VLASLFKTFFGGGSIVDELKKYAELKSVAEMIAGRSPDPIELFKLYRYGMVDTLRFLYLMTRKKFPLKEIMEMDEEGLAKILEGEEEGGEKK
jgi:hypothetical protein